MGTGSSVSFSPMRWRTSAFVRTTPPSLKYTTSHVEVRQKLNDPSSTVSRCSGLTWCLSVCSATGCPVWPHRGQLAFVLAAGFAVTMAEDDGVERQSDINHFSFGNGRKPPAIASFKI